MKAITSIFESILGNGDTIIWTPADGPTEFAAPSTGAKGWGWGTIEANKGWGWGT
jgi:hypothetical protein